MTFATEKTKAQSWKIILVEIDLPRDNEIFINYEAGIWFREMSRLIARTGSFTLYQYYAADNPNNLIFRVSSLRVNDVQYQSVSSLAALRATDETYYYDVLTTNLYIHALNGDNPFLVGDITLGYTTGYTNKTDSTNKSYYDNIYYDPRVLSVPGINKKKDPVFFGKASFQGGNIKLNNSDGELDNYRDNNLYGQNVRVLATFDALDYSEARQIYNGYIEDFSWDRRSFTLNTKDIRKKFEVSLPWNLYTITDWPDLQEDDENKPIPIAYGPVRGGECTFVEEVVAGTKFRFKYMDTEFYTPYALTTVYVDGISVSPDSYDFPTATFILDVSVWPGEGEVTADFTGAGVTTGFNIMKDMFLKYANMPFIDDVYNTTEWTAESASSMTQSVYVKEPTALIDIITNIFISDDAQLFPQDDGKLTCRIYDADRTPAKIIPDYAWVSLPKFKQSSKEFLSSIEIKYNKNHATGEFNKYVNLDYEATVYSLYKKYKQKTIETNLVNEADAIALSNAIMGRASAIKDTVSRTINIEYIDIELMDMIVANHERPDSAEDLAVYEVIGINLKPLSNGEKDLTMRRIKDYP